MNTMQGGVTKLGITSAATTSVERVPSNLLSISEFYSRFMLPNVPVIITNIGTSWLAHTWVDEKGLRAEWLKNEFPLLEASAHNCNPNTKVLGGFRIERKTVAEYMEWWQNRPQTSGPTDDLWYLKDWNFMKGTEDSYKLYECPPYFTEDWLNEHERSHCGDHRFVYLGPKGVFTPLHRDVLCSFSWSVNISGRKKWWLLPPEFEGDLISADGKSHLFDLREIETASHEQFPHLSERTQAAVIVLEQNVNEAMFVPSGWWHQVENLEDTLSINHNWINGANIKWSWKLLQAEIAKIRETVEDCLEDEWLAQEVLRLRFGYNFVDFFEFLSGTLGRELARAYSDLAVKPSVRHVPKRETVDSASPAPAIKKRKESVALFDSKDWCATVNLRIYSLEAIGNIFRELVDQEACKEANCVAPPQCRRIEDVCRRLKALLTHNA